MKGDKFTATWVSHTSISDFLQCPRAYFLKRVYRDPTSGRKIKIATPALSLGQTVHEVIESLSVLPAEKRFSESLTAHFELVWKKVSGQKGGFLDDQIEQTYKNRGLAMLDRIRNHPGPLERLAVKIKMDLPYFFLSEEDNIILCGKIDWLEYIPESDSVHIIDFKTSKNDEKPDSLQLPIYYILASNCQTRPCVKMSYWYIERNDTPTEVELPDITETSAKVLRIARTIKAARKLSRFKCSHETGCSACRPYESLLKNEGTYVGVDEFDNDVYILTAGTGDEMPESEIL